MVLLLCDGAGCVGIQVSLGVRGFYVVAVEVL